MSVVTSSSVEIGRMALGRCSTVTARKWSRICPPFSRSFSRLRRALATPHLPERGQLGSPEALARLPGFFPLVVYFPPTLIHRPPHGWEYARNPIVPTTRGRPSWPTINQRSALP